MWNRLSHHKIILAILAGVSIFLAFPKFNWAPLVFLSPIFFNQLVDKCEGFWQGFRYGFLSSLVVMIGGFYWVSYVIHSFGFFPWIVAIPLYLGFCGFGALNFPLFVGIASWVKKHRLFSTRPGQIFLYLLFIPALFTWAEFHIPKLFPWYIGNALHNTLWAIQIVEITGITYLTFSIYCLGSTLWLWGTHRPKFRPTLFLFPLTLWAIAIGFSWYKLSHPPSTAPLFPPLKVALVQGNIGSLDKLNAERDFQGGIYEKVQYIVQTYLDLATSALSSQASQKKIDLLIWPETALPIDLSTDGIFTRKVIGWVKHSKTSLITGAYATLRKKRDISIYNAAFLLEPSSSGNLSTNIYLKNMLLAFGEYMPFSDWFPSLLKTFPQVSNFSRGTEQNSFSLTRQGHLPDVKVGVTICYEAILPSFFRKVAKNNVHLIVNLTNDSWFGPTSEPDEHAALSIFRAIESRVPLLRVTNTGISMIVNPDGRVVSRTQTERPEVLHGDISLFPRSMPTFYVQHGEWFLFLLAAFSACGIVCLFYFSRHKLHSPHNFVARVDSPLKERIPDATLPD